VAPEHSVRPPAASYRADMTVASSYLQTQRAGNITAGSHWRRGMGGKTRQLPTKSWAVKNCRTIFIQDAKLGLKSSHFGKNLEIKLKFWHPQFPVRKICSLPVVGKLQLFAPHTFLNHDAANRKREEGGEESV